MFLFSWLVVADGDLTKPCSDLQLSFGYIEREDQERFTFSFTAFFGNPNAMKPGVRVHFTPCKDKVS